MNQAMKGNSQACGLAVDPLYLSDPSGHQIGPREPLKSEQLKEVRENDSACHNPLSERQRFINPVLTNPQG